MTVAGLGLPTVVTLAFLIGIAAFGIGYYVRSRSARKESRGPIDPFQSDANLRRIFESIQDYAIFTYKSDHTITSWNPGVLRVLGFSQDEFIGMKLDMIFGDAERRAGIPDQEISRALANGSSITEGIRIRKNGRPFWGSGMVRPLVGLNGQVEGFIKVLQDLTIRRQLEESLEEAKKIAEEANAAKDEFIAVLSHELRSPLTPISIALDGMETETPTEHSKMFIDMIRRNLDLELRLIDDLLDVTRITRGKLAMKLETFDAHTKIRQTAEMLRNEMNQKHLQYTEMMNATDHHILADPARFQQIIWNLLRNAVKFTPENGCIFVDSTNEGGMLIITVRDTGIGMSEEAMKHIFRPFVQGMPSIARKYGGLGLGLTIARALTQNFSGKLSAASEGPGRGTTFTVELPTVAPAGNTNSLAATNGHSHDRRKGKILLVDDQEDARTSLSALLANRGYEVETTNSVRGAVDHVRKNSYDLILSDIQLEGESGWDLPGRLPRPIPAIAVSALGTPANVEMSLRSGFIDHITKPFRINDLDAEIQKVLAIPDPQ
jgi:PAS domain S-box-containing protein